MYITCQKCSTNFVVNFEQIGSKGRRVRCSKCRHTWHAGPVTTPEANEILTPEIELLKPLAGGVHLPVVLSREPDRPSSDWIIFLIMFVIFSFAIFFSKSVDFGFINKASNNLELSDVKVYHAKGADKMTLHYNIANNGDHTATMPDMRIQLFDSANHLIKTYDMMGAEAELEPHQNLKFRTEFETIPANVDIINMTIVNKLDLLFR